MTWRDEGQTPRTSFIVPYIKGCSEGAILAGRSFKYHLHLFLKKSSQASDRAATLRIQFTSDAKHFGDKKSFSGHLASSVEGGT